MMKKRICALLTMVMCISAAMPVSAANISTNEDLELVTEVVEAMNNEDVTTYISLFDEENQLLMNEYVMENGTDDFFQAEKTTVLNAKELTPELGISVARITAAEQETYEDIRVIYVKEKVKAKAGSDVVEDGVDYNAYVIGTEDGTRKIIRISAASLDVIEDSKQGFGDEPQAVWTLPSSVKIYFTKSQNQSHYGKNSATISFYGYLKDVIPNEWIVSYYGSYPAYLEAGAMASKMYAWYHTIYPSYDYSPYYADMKDNTSSQEYLVGSYSALASRYQGYIDSTLSSTYKIAMTKSGSAIASCVFETQYRSNSGSQGSGILNASTAYTLAKSGNSYQQILRYFYDYSSAAGGGAVVFRQCSTGSGGGEIMRDGMNVE